MDSGGSPPPYKHIEVTRKGHVTTVMICREEARNAVNGPCAQELIHAFDAFDRDTTQRAAVLCGRGGHFCAGADLHSVSSGKDAPRIDIGQKEGPMGPTRMILSKPVIAAVSGPCVAGGLELAVWCDMRVVEETAYFGVYCRRFGVPLIDGGTIRLPRLIGQSRAMDMILTGRKVTADEALSFGLANRVAPHGTSREAAEALAKEISMFPQATMRADRMSAITGWDAPYADVLDREFEAALHTLSDAKAGASRFSSGDGRHGKFAKL